MTIAAAVLVLLVLTRPSIGVARFVFLAPAAKRNWLPARWARLRWRWFCRNAQLGYLDRHHRRLIRPRLPFTTAVRVRERPVHLMRFPRAHFHADAYGLVANVATIPHVARAEFEQAAAYIADSWRCHRVQIAQPAPGRLMIRGLRTDPLAEPFGIDQAPPGVYGTTSVQAPSRVYLGRDEWGTDRWAQLANITGAVIGGQPGTGKTTLANSMLMQLAPSPAVQLAIADGQGGADFHSWRDRAYLYAGDDPAAGAAVLEDVHALMRHRFATVLEATGHKNAWHAGPSEAFPLVLLIVDEAGNYLDEQAAKGQPYEKHVRTCRAMLSQLVRRGRSVLVWTVLLSQKPTTDQIPSQVRDNAALRLCGAVQTIEGAIAVLGDSIRTYPTVSPTALSAPEDAGIFTAKLRTAGSPYVRLRCPEITEEAADERARLTAPLRRDPRTPAPGPAPVSPAPAPSRVA